MASFVLLLVGFETYGKTAFLAVKIFGESTIRGVYLAVAVRAKNLNMVSSTEHPGIDEVLDFFSRSNESESHRTVHALTDMQGSSTFGVDVDWSVALWASKPHPRQQITPLFSLAVLRPSRRLCTWGFSWLKGHVFFVPLEHKASHWRYW